MLSAPLRQVALLLLFAGCTGKSDTGTDTEGTDAVSVKVVAVSVRSIESAIRVA